MYPSNFNLSHMLLVERLDTMRREAAQARQISRQPGLLARAWQALNTHFRPQTSVRPS